MGRIFPNGLLLRDGDEHKHHRKIMHEAFKRAALREYAARMNPMIESGIADWASGDGQRLAFQSYKTLTLDIAASIFVGVDLGPETRAHERRLRGPGGGVDVGASACRSRASSSSAASRVASSWRATSATCCRRSAPAQGGDMFSRLSRAAERDRRPLRRLRRRRPHDLPDDGRARHDHQHAHVDDLRARAPSGMAGARARGERSRSASRSSTSTTSTARRSSAW